MVSFIGVERGGSLAPAALWCARLATSVLRVRERTPEDQMRGALERIAARAPHLLSDIGFTPDPRESSPSETIWVRGSLRVSISAVDGAVVVLPE